MPCKAAAPTHPTPHIALNPTLTSMSWGLGLTEVCRLGAEGHEARLSVTAGSPLKSIASGRLTISPTSCDRLSAASSSRMLGISERSSGMRRCREESGRPPPLPLRGYSSRRSSERLRA